MADLAGRKVFKVFNQDFIVDERYNVTKELGQGAYGIVWYARNFSSRALFAPTGGLSSQETCNIELTCIPSQRRYEQSNR